MGLDKVKEEILEKARQDAEKIIGDARAEAKTVLKLAEKQAQEQGRIMGEGLESSLAGMKRRELASAELEMQKKVLAKKRELIEAVFSEAGRKLKAFSEKKREAHVKRLFGQAVKEMDVAVIRSSSRDVKFFSADAGSFGKLKIIADDSLCGGLVAESPDGRFRVDYSYDAILGQVRRKVLSDVARALFGK